MEAVGSEATSFRLEVGDAVHDHMVQKQGLAVHFDGAREQATGAMHVPGARRGAASARRGSVLETQPSCSSPQHTALGGLPTPHHLHQSPGSLTLGPHPCCYRY